MDLDNYRIFKRRRYALSIKTVPTT